MRRRPPYLRLIKTLIKFELGCKALQAINYFLVQQSSSFVSSFVQSKKAALYLITDIGKVFNAWNRFFPLRQFFMNSFTLFLYSSFTFLFISSQIILSISKMLRYFYPPVPASTISFPFDSWIPSNVVFLPLCSDTTAHFKIPNSIFISLLHCHTVSIKGSISFKF